MLLRQPKIQVTAGGAEIGLVVAAETVNDGPFTAGRFQVTVPVSSALGLDVDYVLGLGGQPIEIEAAEAGGYSSLLMGRVDGVRVDAARRLAVLYGRDLAAGLIDAELSESFVNQTASQVAEALAARHQLSANVTATEQLIGQYNQIDHVRTSLLVNSKWTTEWALLTGLAQAEGFSLSVTGTMLNFGPAMAQSTRLVSPGDFISLAFDVISVLPGAVTVKSWSPRKKAVASATEGTGQEMSLVRANLTNAQAQNAAGNRLSVLVGHQRLLVGSMEGDSTLSPGDVLVLSGTGSSLDAAYVVMSVARKISAAGGFVQMVRASLVN